MLTRALVLAWLAAGVPLLAARAADWEAGATRLWAGAHVASPTYLRPIVNLAVARRAAGDYAGAALLFDVARAGVLDPRRPGREREEATFVLLANDLIFAARTGRVEEARLRLRDLRERYAIIEQNTYAFLEEAVR